MRTSGPLSVVDRPLAENVVAVIREAVSNVVKHARATTVTVSITVADELVVQVIDNGIGLPADVTPSGLANLALRAEKAGGTFTTTPPPGGGLALRWSAQL